LGGRKPSQRGTGRPNAKGTKGGTTNITYRGGGRRKGQKSEYLPKPRGRKGKSRKSTGKEKGGVKWGKKGW